MPEGSEEGHVMKDVYSGRRLSLMLICFGPFCALFVVFYLAPIVYGIVMGLYDVKLTSDVFVGLQNFFALGSDSIFWASFWNTLLYVAIMTVGGFVPMIIALILELYLKENDRFKRVYYAVTLVPYLTTWMALASAWRFITGSYLPAALAEIQNVLPISIEYANPLNSPEMALPTIALIWLWTFVGFNILLLRTGIKSIDPAMIEAARVDGASNGRIFFGIVLPQMVPYIVFMATMGLIWTFQIFDPIWLLTGQGTGGPGGWTTSSITYYVVIVAKRYFQFGYASAMGAIVSLVVLVISIFQFRLMYKRLV